MIYICLEFTIWLIFPMLSQKIHDDTVPIFPSMSLSNYLCFYVLSDFLIYSVPLKWLLPTISPPIFTKRLYTFLNNPYIICGLFSNIWTSLVQPLYVNDLHKSLIWLIFPMLFLYLHDDTAPFFPQCPCIILFFLLLKSKQKEWHPATKPLKTSLCFYVFLLYSVLLFHAS